MRASRRKRFHLVGGAGQCGADRLDGDDGAVGVADGQVDHPHAPAPQFAEQLAAGEELRLREDVRLAARTKGERGGAFAGVAHPAAFERWDDGRQQRRRQRRGRGRWRRSGQRQGAGQADRQDGMACLDGVSLGEQGRSAQPSAVEEGPIVAAHVHQAGLGRVGLDHEVDAQEIAVAAAELEVRLPRPADQKGVVAGEAEHAAGVGAGRHAQDDGRLGRRRRQGGESGRQERQQVVRLRRRRGGVAKLPRRMDQRSRPAPGVPRSVDRRRGRAPPGRGPGAAPPWPLPQPLRSRPAGTARRGCATRSARRRTAIAGGRSPRERRGPGGGGASAAFARWAWQGREKDDSAQGVD